MAGKSTTNREVITHAAGVTDDINSGTPEDDYFSHLGICN
jgi:hypothetical protein